MKTRIYTDNGGAVWLVEKHYKELEKILSRAEIEDYSSCIQTYQTFINRGKVPYDRNLASHSIQYYKRYIYYVVMQKYGFNDTCKNIYITYADKYLIENLDVSIQYMEVFIKALKNNIVSSSKIESPAYYYDKLINGNINISALNSLEHKQAFMACALREVISKEDVETQKDIMDVLTKQKNKYIIGKFLYERLFNDGGAFYLNLNLSRDELNDVFKALVVARDEEMQEALIKYNKLIKKFAMKKRTKGRTYYRRNLKKIKKQIHKIERKFPEKLSVNFNTLLANVKITDNVIRRLYY